MSTTKWKTQVEFTVQGRKPGPHMSAKAQKAIDTLMKRTARALDATMEAERGKNAQTD